MDPTRNKAKRQYQSAQRLLSAKKEAPEPFHGPIQTADLSFGHWVTSPDDDDDDTASSVSASSKAAQSGSMLSEESLMCDEEIGECTQPAPKRQRKSCVGVTSNVSPTKDLTWLLHDSMQDGDLWFQLCIPHHRLPNTVHPTQLRMHA